MFVLHPETKFYRKVILNQWMLDLFSCLGGYFVFVHFMFKLCCLHVPSALMYANLAEETLRVKFNKFLFKVNLSKQENDRLRNHHRRKMKGRKRCCWCCIIKKSDLKDEESTEDSFMTRTPLPFMMQNRDEAIPEAPENEEMDPEEFHEEKSEEKAWEEADKIDFFTETQKEGGNSDEEKGSRKHPDQIKTADMNYNLLVKPVNDINFEIENDGPESAKNHMNSAYAGNRDAI